MFRVLIFNINRSKSMFGKTCSVAKDVFVINMVTRYSILLGLVIERNGFVQPVVFEM